MTVTIRLATREDYASLVPIDSDYERHGVKTLTRQMTLPLE